MCPGNQKQFPNSGVEKCDGRGIREEAAGGCRATWLMPGVFTSYVVQTWSFESGMDAYKEYVGKQDVLGKPGYECACVVTLISTTGDLRGFMRGSSSRFQDERLEC